MPATPRGGRRAVAEPKREARQQEEAVDAQIAAPQHRAEPGPGVGHVQRQVEVIEDHPADQEESQPREPGMPLPRTRRLHRPAIPHLTQP